MSTPAWIELDGAVNARDLAGLPTVDGRAVVPHRLIRSDNLQQLTEQDVRLLVDEYDVRAVADLRTGVEVRGEGPGPLTREPAVTLQHLSLFPEPDEVEVEQTDDGPIVLPWQERSDAMTEEQKKRGVSGVYLRYLDDRADSVIGALRLVADTDGATIVHCAAGKDRTGVVVAIALTEVGVTREAIVADYAATAERIRGILERLSSRATYQNDLKVDADVDKHTPRAVTMERLLEAIDEEFGGVRAWLRSHGWTEGDAARLRARLLE